MKTLLIFSLLLGTGLSTNAQVVKDPLFAYYSRLTSSASSDGEAPPSQQSKIYWFKAAFTGSQAEAIFITDDECNVGRSQYVWTIYCPVATGGFQTVGDSTHFLLAGLKGPDYVGYIDQIKHYGAITGGKRSVVAHYLDDGILLSKAIDQNRDHDNADYYPKYFHDHAPDYHIVTTTVAQLAQKYAGQ